MSFEYKDMLARVRQAIMGIETEGQAVDLEMDGVSEKMTRANLATLYKREAYLLRMVEREERGGAIIYGVPT